MAALRIVTPVVVALALSPAARAQELPILARPQLSCRFDLTAARDTIDFTLFLTPPRTIPQAGRQRDQYTPYLQAIASTFVQPQRLTVSYWPGTWAEDQIERKSPVGNCDAWCLVGPMEGEIQFNLENDSVTAVSWPVVPDSREVMRAVELAIREADSLTLFPHAPKFAGLPSGTVRLAVRLSRWAPAIGSVPIGRVRLPHVRQTKVVEVLYQPHPHFPNSAVEFGLSGPVSLQYVVGEDGLVPEETIRVLEAAHPAFINPAVRAILGSRFRPAEAGGCPDQADGAPASCVSALSRPSRGRTVPRRHVPPAAAGVHCSPVN